MKNYSKLTLAAAGVAATMACTSTSALAQSADALIDKLVDKGVLSVKEANDLREEADKNFTTAYSVKSGMPEWVTSFKMNGDFRGRYEGFYSDHPNFVERNRFRYRARLGFTAVMKDNFEVGLRLGSGDIDSFPANGLDPISNNQSLQNNASKKGIFIDLAYGKWTAVNNPDWLVSATLGKMENPFVFSDMVFDGDYTPEGAVQLGYNLSDKHALKLNSGAFVLDEISGTTDDPFMFGVQGRLESTWSPKMATSVGVAYLAVIHQNTLTNGAVPNINVGDARGAGVGQLTYDFTPVVADASATYLVDSFPMYPGAFPIKVGGDYMNNSGAASAADNYGWSAGIAFGKAGKKGTWELAYTYKWLGANAWWEEVVDSDFGAFYANSPLNSGKTANSGDYFAGTNVKGHIVKLSYSPFDSLTLSAKLFLTQLINDNGSALTAPLPANTKSDMTRLQVDAVLKF